MSSFSTYVSVLATLEADNIDADFVQISNNKSGWLARDKRLA